MTLTVGQLIRELQKYNPNSEINYVIKNNHKVAIVDVVSYEFSKPMAENEHNVGLYFKYHLTQNGKLTLNNLF